MPIFKLILRKTYYNWGFFNVTIDYDRYIGNNKCSIELHVDGGKIINGWINRSAQNNGTARIMGRTALSDFFRSNFKQGDTVNIEILSLNSIKIQTLFASTSGNH